MKKLHRLAVFIILFFIVTAPIWHADNVNKFFSGLKREEFNIESLLKNKAESEDLLNVHFIDVGQGDCSFIELPNGENMLIDAGEKTESDKVIKYIKQQGAEKIDFLIGTHPHSDHIGGLVQVINEFEIGKMYMPKAGNSTKTFENLLDQIEENNVDVYTARAGVLLYEDEKIKIQILAPVFSDYESLNDYSVVIRIDYGETSFLFMGDAEELSENEIKEDVNCDVLKVGHHGSGTSSSNQFLSRARPKFAVISVGENNDYGHPSKSVLDRLSRIGAEILRTDKSGDIIIKSDGLNIFVKED
ncbi:MAG: MBL fold metallo-hydrolase [Ruminococcaceae bacterium]|nr:MBL fold metallo-hydrolase [Oscillospiraceae bacterium]